MVDWQSEIDLDSIRNSCDVFILDYDSMCSEMDFTPEKSFSSNYKNSQLLLTAAAALSQNGQIAV